MKVAYKIDWISLRTWQVEGQLYREKNIYESFLFGRVMDPRLGELYSIAWHFVLLRPALSHLHCPG